MWIFWLTAWACLAVSLGENVFLEDLNNDHDKRNLHFGLPETLKFRLAHSSGVVNLNLKENKRLNAVHAPVLVPGKGEDGRKRAVKVELPANNKVKYYQDLDNHAYFTAECFTQPGTACRRTLTGNLYIGDQEYKLQPDNEHVASRRLEAHLGIGTPHILERLERPAYSSHKAGDHAAATTVLDYVMPEDERASVITQVDDEELNNKRETERLLKTLLDKLERLETRRVARTGGQRHEVEVLLAIDHVIYEPFKEVLLSEQEAMYEVRKYYCHILNGVDLTYESIDEDDFGIDIIAAGFFISRNEAESPWLNYTEDPTDGLAGLYYMRDWRSNTMDLPDNDHAAFITGTDIGYSGSRGVAGIAFMNGACRYSGVSINEEMGFYYGALVLAHEIGHNLGSPHDSSDDPSCYDKYVMSPYLTGLSSTSTTTNPWKFSSCSVASFKSYLGSFGTNECTFYTSTGVYNETEHDSHLMNRYSEDEQCMLLLGSDAYMCNNEARNTAAVCRNLWCQSSTTSCGGNYIAAFGTPCGNGMICYQGTCTNASECFGHDCDRNTTSPSPSPNPSQPPSTSEATTPYYSTPGPDRYNCTDIGVGEYSCRRMLEIFGSKGKLCKKHAHECCGMCTAGKFCKKDVAKLAIKEKLTCPEFMDAYGHTFGCRLFTKPCCVTCTQ